MKSLNGMHNPTNRRGQTLVIAIMVMFLLAVVATIFIAVVARNLFQAGRSSNVDSVAQIAEAGVRYADEMLTTSEEGADWRPIPDNVGVTDPGVLPSTSPTPDPDWKYMRDNYPDFEWIRPYWPTECFPSGYSPNPGEIGFAGPTGGYTTYNTGQGRYLLRISYNPDPKDPLSKYIKIDSIGRWGVFLKDDPTTYKNAGNYRMKREITAYKPIGLTEYLRFVTNKDNKSVDVALGVPGYSVSFGRSPSSRYGVRGGPIRVNGDLTWYGKFSSDAGVDIYLRGVNSVDDDNNEKPAPLDQVEVSGNIFEDNDPSNNNNPVRVDVHTVIGSNVQTTTVKPSNDSNFTTVAGFYRDGSDSTDVGHYARGVKRIDPPLVDQLDPTNTTTRYRLLTLNSGERFQIAPDRWVNLGRYGWGRGIYIGNTRDKQDNSETLTGGYTQRSDWLDLLNPRSAYWKGPFYVPPAAIITLIPDDYEDIPVNGKTVRQYYLRITRTDGGNRRGAIWYDAEGNSRPEWGETVRVPYPDIDNGRVLTPALGSKSVKRIEGNGVIFAEGNVRVRGMLPPGMKLTIVSNKTIYIDGNVLKYRKGKPSDSDPYRGADPTCGLALLAHDNICVNTTQFFAPQNSISADDVESDAGNNQPPFHVVVSSNPETQMRIAFEFGPYESESGGTDPDSWALFLRHSGQGGATYINAWLNPGSNVTDNGILHLNDVMTSLPSHVWGIGDPRFNAPGWGLGTKFVGQVFPLDSLLNANLITEPGVSNLLQIALDQTSFTGRNYMLGGVAVQPNDIRIEAILYAQEGSFFVLPGSWFNPDSSDVPSEGGRPKGVASTFPYFGQPLDVRIVIDGTVAENLPASVSDVEEWMSKWGDIPEYYGSSTRKTKHPHEGLTFLYDDHAGWPLRDLNDPNSAIRRDGFGRPLPMAPRLPVSGSLIYSGDVM